MAGEKSRNDWLATFTVIGLTLTTLGSLLGSGRARILLAAAGVLVIFAALLWWAMRSGRVKGGGGLAS